MYSYKLNNSYTVYVNWYYLNESKKKCKSPASLTHYNEPPKKQTDRIIQFSPLPNGTKLKSAFFGEGTICSTNQRGIMEVEFDSRMVKFLFPDALQQGYLVRI